MIERLLKGAVGFLFWADRRFYKALLGPAGLLLLVWLIERLAHRLPPEQILAHLGLSLAMIVALLVSTTLIAVMVHRRVVLGQGDDFGIGLFWSPRETAFVWRLLGLILIALPAVPLALVPGIGPFLGALLASYLIARCSLVFPAIAVGQPMGYRQSWRVMSRVQGPLVVTLVLLPFLFGLPLRLLEVTPWLMPISLLADLVLTLYLTAILSLLYREISAAPSADATTAAQQ
ncbi:MAG: hypothetical protein ACXIUB_03990 [Wenzhouxiangella sp.]